MPRSSPIGRVMTRSSPIGRVMTRFSPIGLLMPRSCLIGRVMPRFSPIGQVMPPMPLAFISELSNPLNQIHCRTKMFSSWVLQTTSKTELDKQNYNNSKV
uniref:Uncharacterized protein n=1 Tax=Anguilla anguilla TaxID=7936 RepID=A0A0E9PFE3_ANGAN